MRAEPIDMAAGREDVGPLRPLESFERWNRQQWSIAEFDLAADRAAWQSRPHPLGTPVPSYAIRPGAITEP